MDAIQLAKSFSNRYLKEGHTYYPTEVVMALIHKYNIALHHWKFRVDKLSGMLLHEKGFGYMIVINQSHHYKKKTFTLAHELGHFFLHRKFQKQFCCNDMLKEIDRSIEREANTFAAELLMPEIIMIDRISKRRSFSYIANELHVSYEAVKWRFINLCENHVPGFFEKKEQIIKTLFENERRLLY